MMSAPVSRTWSRYIALTVPTVPTGMKAGVRIVPRGMPTSPRRAPPSVAFRVNWNVSVMMSLSWGFAEEQAGIAVGIEAIARSDGMPVGIAHRVQPAECRYQHEQRRFRQMEIRHQHIDCLEAVAWRDEDLGGATPRLHRSVVGTGALDQPQRGRSNADDTPAPGPDGVQPCGCLGID